MNELINLVSAYLEYPFVRYALIVGVLIALCSALLGVVLVLRRYSFIGDGLSHVAFGALAIATVLKIGNDMIVVLPVTVACAIALLCTGSTSKIKGDSALAMFSVGALAVGYLLLNIFPSSSNVGGDVCGTLFGSTSILTLSKTDVWICIAMSVIVIVLFVLFYDKIFAITFDEAFAAATGIRVKFYNVLISLICAIIIVLAMNLAGSLLTSALVVFPAVSAMRIFKSFRSVVISAALISVFCALVGIVASIVFALPVGAAIVAVDIVAFICCSIVGRVALIK